MINDTISYGMLNRFEIETLLCALKNNKEFSNFKIDSNYQAKDYISEGSVFKKKGETTVTIKTCSKIKLVIY